MDRDLPTVVVAKAALGSALVGRRRRGRRQPSLPSAHGALPEPSSRAGDAAAMPAPCVPFSLARRSG
jgi:hypothetical protein